MSTQKINASEKDLEKFIRFWTMKATQVILQSRLGEKISTQGSPLAGTDWFNIAIKDHPEVLAETKKVLAANSSETILKSFPLCIEISLKTAEGDQMVLEVWSVDLQTPGMQQKDEKSGSNSSLNDQQILKAAHTIYNRLGIMLKSLISLTRATPAYKLSRRQCPDSYRIHYRIYVDKPQVHALGEGPKYVKIGQINTIVGILTMSVAYRTKMTITPTTVQQKANESNAIMLKSDHFRPSDLTQSQQMMNNGYKRGSNGSNLERKVIDIEKPLRPGAFTDVAKLKQFTEEDYILPETPPFEWLLRRAKNESIGSGSIESLNRKNESPSPSPLSNGYQNALNINNNHLSNGARTINNNTTLLNNNNVATFKNLENESLSKSPVQTSCLSASPPVPIKSLIVPTPPASRHSSAPTLPQANVPDDDSLLKELHFPFASPSSHVSDLAKFYRDCYHAPPLHCLSEIQTETAGSCGAAALAANNADSNAVDELSRQLEQFETSLEDYDKLVSQLGLTGSSSTGSRSSGGLQMSN